MSLIEVLVAAFIVSLIFVGTFGVVSAARQAGSLSSEKMQALYYGQAAMESIRNVRDTNLENNQPFNNGIGASSDYRSISCVSGSWPNCTGGFTVGTGTANMDITGTGFTRTIQITSVPAGLDVAVTINWKNNKSAIKLEEILTNWKQ